MRGEYSTAVALGNELLTGSPGREWHPQSSKLKGNLVLGIAHFFSGRLLDSSIALQRAIDIYDPANHAAYASAQRLEYHNIFAPCRQPDIM